MLTFCASLDLPVEFFACTIPTPSSVKEFPGFSGYVRGDLSQVSLRLQAKEACSLKDIGVNFQPEALVELIKWCASEIRVQNLEKYVRKLDGKAALRSGRLVTINLSLCSCFVVFFDRLSPAANPSTSDSDIQRSGEGRPTATVDGKPMNIRSRVHVRIAPWNSNEFVGPAADRMVGGTIKTDGSKATNGLPLPGVSTSLGCLDHGRRAGMPIEAMSMVGKGSLQLTGDAIRDPIQIAISCVKAYPYEPGLNMSPNDVFVADRDIHVHMSEDAVGTQLQVLLPPSSSLSRWTEAKVLASHRVEIKAIIASKLRVETLKRTFWIASKRASDRVR
ncbi:hypothetical protein BKA70DRAFT_1442387 [Coprinopsis sp. MPI-PUGE-AT-0042]|nr:hypothetical protein BKA70DRAFT_1442387 [Coprinopsis sp. MPI-PUGE-AT-0042]